MVVPPKHPKMITFSRKTYGCWVPLYHHFRKPLYVCCVHVCQLTECLQWPAARNVAHLAGSPVRCEGGNLDKEKHFDSRKTQNASLITFILGLATLPSSKPSMKTSSLDDENVGRGSLPLYHHIPWGCVRLQSTLHSHDMKHAEMENIEH